MDSNSRVLVTGATGYVAGWVIRRLLEEGVTVHAAVRDPRNTSKVSHLVEMAEGLPGTIQFFGADLLKDKSYAEAMDGCEVVFHTASPFSMSVKDPQNELIAPALKGTQNVLKQANCTPSVRRIVVTSSYMAAIGDNADLKDLGKSKVDESDWNSTSSLKHQPYAYSKMLAEKEAWQLEASQDQWSLATINPAFVMGPSLAANPTTESYHFMKKCGDGTLKMGVPNVGMSFVDVREVAEAHFMAADLPEAHGRYLVSAASSTLPEMIEMLRNRFGDDFPFPRRTLPKWFVWALGPIFDDTLARKAVTRNVDHPLHLDNSRSIKELSISYRPVADTLGDMFQQMIDRKVFA